MLFSFIFIASSSTNVIADSKNKFSKKNLKEINKENYIFKNLKMLPNKIKENIEVSILFGTIITGLTVYFARNKNIDIPGCFKKDYDFFKSKKKNKEFKDKIEKIYKKEACRINDKDLKDIILKTLGEIVKILDEGFTESLDHKVSFLINLFADDKSKIHLTNNKPSQNVQENKTVDVVESDKSSDKDSDIEFIKEKKSEMEISDYNIKKERKEMATKHKTFIKNFNEKYYKSDWPLFPEDKEEFKQIKTMNLIKSNHIEIKKIIDESSQKELAIATYAELMWSFRIVYREDRVKKYKIFDHFKDIITLVTVESNADHFRRCMKNLFEQFHILEKLYTKHEYVLISNAIFTIHSNLKNLYEGNSTEDKHSYLPTLKEDILVENIKKAIEKLDSAKNVPLKIIILNIKSKLSKTIDEFNKKWKDDTKKGSKESKYIFGVPFDEGGRYVPYINKNSNLKKYLGKGGEGKVKICYDKVDQKKVAVKSFTKSSDIPRIENNYDKLKNIDSEHIVKVLNLITNNEKGRRRKAVLIMDYVPGHEQVATYSYRQTKDKVLDLVIGITKGIKAMQDAKLRHPDLRQHMNNIIVDKFGKVKIIDYELATNFSDSDHPNIIYGNIVDTLSCVGTILFNSYKDLYNKFLEKFKNLNLRQDKYKDKINYSFDLPIRLGEGNERDNLLPTFDYLIEFLEKMKKSL